MNAPAHEPGAPAPVEPTPEADEREWFCYAGSVGHPVNDCTPEDPHNADRCGWADEGYGNSPTAVAARRAPVLCESEERER